jgi:mono/diheme cytochrome c family protein
MNLFKWIVFCEIVSAPLLVLAQSPTTPAQGAGSQKKTTQKPLPVNEGERVFAQNCSRCHNPPDGFSPRISGSVVRHMRVRANLSEKDAQAVLRFFNP